MAGPATPMHENFARWYDSVSLDDDSEARAARWQGLIDLLEDIEAPTVEALVRLVFAGRTPAAPAAVKVIRQAFRGADETFEMSGNDRELQVLAGSALAVLMSDSENDQAANAALATATAALAGRRQCDVPMGLAAMSEDAIARLGHVYRERPTLSEVSVQLPKLEFSKAAAKVRTQNDWVGVSEAFSLAAEEMRSALTILATSHNEAVEIMDDFVRIQDEEVQMLWWLVGERSEALNCSFKEVPADAKPFVFAYELAASTRVLPGPPSIKGLLSRAGLSSRVQLSVTAAVNACEPQWVQGFIAEVEPSPVTAPLHFALKRQLETGPGNAWVPGWAATCGVDQSLALSSLALGELFYRERLLLGRE